MSKHKSSKSSKLATKSAQATSVLPLFGEDALDSDRLCAKTQYEDPDGVPKLPFVCGQEIEWLRPSEIWPALGGKFVVAAGGKTASAPTIAEDAVDKKPKTKSKGSRGRDKKASSDKAKKDDAKGQQARLPDNEARPPQEEPGPPLCGFDIQALLSHTGTSGGGAGEGDGAAALEDAHLPFLRWLASMFSVMGASQVNTKAWQFLYDGIYPQDQEHRPVYNASGKYVLRLFVGGHWRQLTVDDRLPVVNGQVLFLQSSSPKELWPLLLSKAICKLFTICGTSFDPHNLADVTSACMCWLTGGLPELVRTACDEATMRDLCTSLSSSAIISVITPQAHPEGWKERGLDEGMVYAIKKIIRKAPEEDAMTEAVNSEEADPMGGEPSTDFSPTLLVQLEGLYHCEYDILLDKLEAKKANQRKESAKSVKKRKAAEAARAALLAAQKAAAESVNADGSVSPSLDASPLEKASTKEERDEEDKRPADVSLDFQLFCSMFRDVCVLRNPSAFKFSLTPAILGEGDEGGNYVRRQPTLLYHESEEPVQLLLCLSCALPEPPRRQSLRPRATRPGSASSAATGTVSLSSYDWRGGSETTLYARVTTSSVGSAFVTLPPGARAFKLVCEAPVKSQICVLSSAEVAIGAFNEIHDRLGLITTELDGPRPPQEGGEWVVWFRALLTVSQVLTLVAQLHVDDPLAASYVRLSIVDTNDNSFERSPLLATVPKLFKPRATSDAVYAVVAECAAPCEIPKGLFRLVVLADRDIMPPVCEAPKHIEVQRGIYLPNKYYILFRFVLKWKGSVHCSVNLSCGQADVPITLEVLDDGGTVPHGRLEGKQSLTFPCLTLTRQDEVKKVEKSKGDKNDRRREKSGSRQGEAGGKLVIQASIAPGFFPHPRLGVPAVPVATLGEGVASKKERKKERSSKKDKKEKKSAKADPVPREASPGAVPTLTWKLVVCTDVPVDLAHDTEREDHINSVKASWETGHSGRQSKAHASRDVFLSQRETGEYREKGDPPCTSRSVDEDDNDFGHRAYMTRLHKDAKNVAPSGVVEVASRNPPATRSAEEREAVRLQAQDRADSYRQARNEAKIQRALKLNEREQTKVTEATFAANIQSGLANMREEDHTRRERYRIAHLPVEVDVEEEIAKKCAPAKKAKKKHRRAT